MQKILNFIFDFVFPKRCAGCGAEGLLLCSPCKTNLQEMTPHCFCGFRNMQAKVCSSCQKKTGLTRFYAPFRYDNKTVREMIHRLKYKGVRNYGEILGRALAQSYKRFQIQTPASSIIVPIPLHYSRFQERGFNQSLLIGEVFGTLLNIPLSQGLIRKKETRPQVTLKNYDERQQNVVGVFSIPDATKIFKKTVILIDDVATSGATLREAAQTLRKAGARSVWALTIAR